MGVEAQPEDENLCGGTPSDTRENSQAFPSTDKHVPPEFEAPVRSHGDRRRAGRCILARLGDNGVVWNILSFWQETK